MNNNIFKVLFLDIDSVLNSEDYFKNRADEDNRPYPSSEFDPRAIRRLNQILGYCDQLVLSSDWRFQEGIKYTLIDAGVNKDKVDNMLCTPYLGHTFKDRLRGYEVDFVVKNLCRKYPKLNYVILDDLMEFHKFQKPHWVKTTFRDGLTDEKMEKAIEIIMDTGLYIRNDY